MRSRLQRRRTPLAVCIAGAAIGLVACKAALSFVGVRAPAAMNAAHERSGVAVVTRKAAVNDGVVRDSEGNKIKGGPVFNAADPSQAGGALTAEFKKRPSGITAYAPCSGTGKGAMVWNMRDTSRYPGDPLGQAFVTGVQKGMAIKSINGQDVTAMDLFDIMDLMDDKIMDNAAGKFQSGSGGPSGLAPAELPLNIEYVMIKADGSSDAEANVVGNTIDPNDDRYKDLPRDATLIEYKIPKGSPISSAVVEEMRAYTMTLPEPVGYVGPRYTGGANIDQAWLTQMIGNAKQGKLLPMKDAYMMAVDFFDILKMEKTLGRVTVPEGKKVTVVGDLHGQLYDFDHMLSLAGFPSSENQFLFNGDFVDRGPWSVEVMFSLIAFKLRNPSSVWLNRGNHESAMANHFYGFFGEVQVKYEKKMTSLFEEIFKATPLCHVINGEVFVVHGGIPGPDPRIWWKGMDNQISFEGRQLQISLKEIEESDRFMEPNPEDNPLMIDLLWSDPKGKDGYGPSGRMSSGIYLFGPDISRNFMQFNGLKMVMRSHEVKADGYRYDHDGEYPLITVFSAPNYVDKAGNRASVAVLTNNGGALGKPDMIQYDAQPHPDVPSGAYAAGGPLHPDTVAAR